MSPFLWNWLATTSSLLVKPPYTADAKTQRDCISSPLPMSMAVLVNLVSDQLVARSKFLLQQLQERGCPQRRLWPTSPVLVESWATQTPPIKQRFKAIGPHRVSLLFLPGSLLPQALTFCCFYPQTLMHLKALIVCYPSLPGAPIPASTLETPHPYHLVMSVITFLTQNLILPNHQYGFFLDQVQPWSNQRLFLGTWVYLSEGNGVLCLLSHPNPLCTPTPKPFSASIIACSRGFSLTPSKAKQICCEFEPSFINA